MYTGTMETAITLILAGVLVVREYQNWRDRKDLLDRIMCVDYREFKQKAHSPRPPGGNVRMSDEEMAAEERKAEKK